MNLSNTVWYALIQKTLRSYYLLLCSLFLPSFIHLLCLFHTTLPLLFPHCALSNQSFSIYILWSSSSLFTLNSNLPACISQCPTSSSAKSWITFLQRGVWWSHCGWPWPTTCWINDEKEKVLTFCLQLLKYLCFMLTLTLWMTEFVIYSVSRTLTLVIWTKEIKI